jgi:hypothetical protein
VAGELHLTWSAFDPNWRNAGGGVAPLAAPVAGDDEGGINDDLENSEEQLNLVFNQMTPEQQERFKSLLPNMGREDFVAPPVPKDQVPPTPPGPTEGAFPDEDQAEYRQAVANAYCGALTGAATLAQASCANAAPFTTLVHTGDDAATGWFTTPVMVKLTATDLSGNGIDHSEYSFSGTSWLRYAGPFTLPEGVTVLSYRSVDKAGVVEAAKQQTFMVDTLAPQSVLTIGLPQFGAAPLITSATPLTLTGTDAGSGVAMVAYRFFRQGSPVPVYTTQPGATVVFALSGPSGTYQIDTLVTDVAGNTNSASRNVQFTDATVWMPNKTYQVGDKVVFDGLVYVCRQAHTSQIGWEPPKTFALWARTETGGIWAPQVIYKTGDVVSFQARNYKAIQGHQSQLGWEPPNVPALWQSIN